MSDFEDRLNSILNDPAQMEKITSMAKSLMGGGETAQERPEMKTQKGSGLFENFDPAMLGRLSAVMGGMHRNDDKQALLEAVKPYLSQPRREKLERAMKLARMIHMAEIAFGVMGGNDAKI